MNDTKTHPLKAARERRNLSQKQLADFTQLGLATIQRAERGKALRPDVRQRLSDYFGISSLDLGLVNEGYDSEQTVSSSHQGTELQDQAEEPGNNNVDRRDFLYNSLGIVGGALVTPTQTLLNTEPWERFSRALKRPSTIDETTLHHLETLAQGSWQLIPDVTGVVSSDLRGYTIEHLQNVTELLEGSLSESSRKRLSSVGGEFSMIAASMSSNLREFTKAQAFYKASINAAREAGNNQLEAVGLASLAIRLTHLEQADKALPLVQEARRLTTQSGTSITRTWLAAVEAEVQANLNDMSACFRALADAESVPENILPGEDPYMTTFSPSLFAGYSGVCLMRFDEPGDAYNVLQEALNHLTIPSISRRCYILTDLVSACVRRGEIEEASNYANQALTLTAQAKSPALWQRIHDIQQELEPWKNVTLCLHFWKGHHVASNG